MPGGNSFVADLHPAFGGFKDFLQLAFTHGYAHVADFDVLGGNVKFQLFSCWQVEDAVEVCLDAAVKAQEVDVVV